MGWPVFREVACEAGCRNRCLAGRSRFALGRADDVERAVIGFSGTEREREEAQCFDEWIEARDQEERAEELQESFGEFELSDIVRLASGKKGTGEDL
ncbi:hypothetical protein AXG93_1670s1060 [Marchantia polymorpha subsp. ruderalis]|uniref:Uncharacterized protein n=1 Tax=Marchantia polymorpha subsp. ruderalis TaxID=1480154 RepID=A0A176WE18_MARPO|nr:hypothetical protein AXG93_1670s1060 [Marchantia polymorpha subsp. ruderalis]